MLQKTRHDDHSGIFADFPQIFEKISFQKYAAKIIIFLFLITAFSPSAFSCYAKDSSSVSSVSLKAKGAGGVPIGTIIAWPVSQNPEEWDKWLECNGQSISRTVYPELFALIGGNVPDFRGLFLRGLGGSSASLGYTQGDAIRNIYGEFSPSAPSWNLYPSGVFKYFHDGSAEQTKYGNGGRIIFDASNVVPTADENRPINRACQSASKIDPPSAAKTDPPWWLINVCPTLFFEGQFLGNSCLILLF